MNVYQDTLETPIGTLLIRANDMGLTEVSLADNIKVLAANSNDIIVTAKCQLDEFFKGLRDEFDLPVQLTGYPQFYLRVWNALMEVPYGKTISYLNLAKKLGEPKAVRAVGTANSKNPIAIIIPCHRVIGSKGSLVGYAWGLDAKRWLLSHELAHSPVPEHMLF